jgi:uncharacterized protein (TIGR00725 family)
MVQVAVCGPADCSDTETAWAYQTGALLAARGAVVLTGGGSGVMAAALDGAHSASGVVVAIRPDGRPPDHRPADPDRTDAAVTIRTGMGQARNAILIASADAVIAIGGSWGTLSEIALACRTGVPVVSLGGWTILDRTGTRVPGVVLASDPADAVAAALAAVAG